MSPGMWHRTLVYLGLRDEPEDVYDELPDQFAEPEPRRRRTFTRGEPVGAVDHDRGGEPEEAGNVRALHTGDVQVVPPTSISPAASAPLRTPVVEVLVFDDVEQVGSRYRTGQPVLFDVSKSDRETGRRVVDFVSGLTYVSRGSLSKVGDRAFLLVPEGVELPDAEQQRLDELGYQVSAGQRS